MAYLSDSVEGMHTLLKTAEEASAVVGLAFNLQKCASLHLKGHGDNAVLPTVFIIEGQCKTLKPGEPYKYLGIPTEYDVRQPAVSSIGDAR